MTISIKANAAGNAGQINIGATPVVSLPVASGIPFCKNKLFNGEVTRINQRGFDGNWAAKPTWPNGGSQSQREATYGWDMWCKASATEMVQFIEEGNYRPSTVHTLSGIGVTTQQITSPASGNWDIGVPQTARNIQVEEGTVATPFEVRPIGFEFEMCQRYFENGTAQYIGFASAANIFCGGYVPFKVFKRDGPSVTLNTPVENSNLGTQNISSNKTGVRLHANSIAADNYFYTGVYNASAVI